MRICLVSETWTPDINGVAHTLERIAEELSRRGHALQLVRPHPAVGASRRAAGMETELRVAGLAVPGYREVRLGLPAPRRLRRLWREQRPQVVYLATQGPLGWSAQRIARALGIPTVAGWHTNFDHYCADYGMGWLSPLVHRRLRTFHNACKVTLVPTRELALALESQGYERLRVMARGIDGERFSPAHRDPALRKAWGVDEHRPVALHVGRLAAEKNLGLLANTLRDMQDARPDLAIVIVGDGPGRHGLERALPEARFTGFIDRDSLVRHYASADLFVFPSLSETWGNVVLEAMASGLAVVAFHHAAAAALIDADVNGLSVPIGDDEAFREAATKLCQQPARYGRLGRRARRRALAYRWPAIADDFLAALDHAREAYREATRPCGV